MKKAAIMVMGDLKEQDRVVSEHRLQGFECHVSQSSTLYPWELIHSCQQAGFDMVRVVVDKKVHTPDFQNHILSLASRCNIAGEYYCV